MTTWICAACGTVNAAGGGTCTVCGTGRSGVGSVVGAPRVPVVSPTVPPGPAPPSHTAPGAGGQPSGLVPPATTPPVPGTAEAPAAGPVTGGRARRGLPSWAYAAGVVVVLGGAAAGVLVGSGDGAADHPEVEVAISADPSTPPAPAPAIDASADGGGGGVTQPSGEVPPVTSSPTSPRSGRLFGGDVKLRPQPNTIGDEIMRFQGRDGAGLTVLTGPENGWYQVRIDTYEGWVYGGFVDDPSDPACALEWARNVPRTVLDPGGNPIGTTEASSSGSKLFASGPKSAGRWPVTLADGREGSVDGGAIYEARC